MVLLETSETVSLGAFELENGSRLEELSLAYETWGQRAADDGNVILLCHGYTNHPHAAGDAAGWWDGLIGSGRAIDTDRYHVICANMLGSAYGSTGPGSVDPVSGQPYGPDFPEFSTGDIVAAQKRLLDALGITKLAAVIGYSYGGYLTFGWAHRHPEMMRALVVVASGIVGRGSPEMLAALRSRFESCTGWNDGHYYGADPTGTVRGMLEAIRIETLRSYGVDDVLRQQLGSEAAAQAELKRRAGEWAHQFDAHSLIELRRASMAYDGRPDAPKIKAPLLYVLSRTDKAFPPDLAEPTMTLLKEAGVEAEYFEIDSAFGHHAPAADWAKWAPILEEFLQRAAPA
jgi:homoserine O-acetyltransferase/O-succinyltransferase